MLRLKRKVFQGGEVRMRFDGKVALITGAASGIGRATAVLFARQGARVVVGDFDAQGGEETVKAIKGAGGEALFVAVDVSDPVQVNDLVRKAVAAYGGIDILLNAAAVFMFGTALDIDEKSWNRVVSTNLSGTFFCCRAVLPEMIKRGGGSIINVCSTAGAHDAIGNAIAYVASKGGVALLSKALAIDHGQHNVRVNVVIPGPTDTQMLRKFWSEKEIKAAAATLPLGRTGDPGDLARAVLFLASEEASFVTGAMLPVDGGQSAGGLSRKLT